MHVAKDNVKSNPNLAQEKELKLIWRITLV